MRSSRCQLSAGGRWRDASPWAMRSSRCLLSAPLGHWPGLSSNLCGLASPEVVYQPGSCCSRCGWHPLPPLDGSIPDDWEGGYPDLGPDQLQWGTRPPLWLVIGYEDLGCLWWLVPTRESSPRLSNPLPKGCCNRALQQHVAKCLWNVLMLAVRAHDLLICALLTLAKSPESQGGPTRHHCMQYLPGQQSVGPVQPMLVKSGPNSWPRLLYSLRRVLLGQLCHLVGVQMWLWL